MKSSPRGFFPPVHLSLIVHTTYDLHLSGLVQAVPSSIWGWDLDPPLPRVTTVLSTAGQWGQPVEPRKHENTPTCATPHPSGNFVSGTSAALTGNQRQSQPPAISRQLLVSQLPGASPELRSWAPPPKLSQAPSQQPRGAGMVDMISKLARRQSRALRAQVSQKGWGQAQPLKGLAFWVWSCSRPAPHSLRNRL